MGAARLEVMADVLQTERGPKLLTRAQAIPQAAQSADVIIIGAGPTGLACAIEIEKIGRHALVIDKGCVVNSLFHYPSNMTFFTTPDLLEIGDIPFSSANQKPNRDEALEYYRKVAQRYQLQVVQYQTVEAVNGHDGDFRVTATDQHGRIHDYRAKKIVLATGYYDLWNPLGIPGEQLAKVTHYYREPHPYYNADVLVIGGKNSAAISALDLWRHGARVTLVHRQAKLHDHIKYWIRPDIENRIANGEIHAYFNSSVTEIHEDSVLLQTPEGAVELRNDFVFALTGYHPDYDFLRSMGVELSEEQKRPVCDPQTLESNVPGIYVAGVIVAGSRTSEIFIENGRFHGGQIAADLKGKLG